MRSALLCAILFRESKFNIISSIDSLPSHLSMSSISPRRHDICQYMLLSNYDLDEDSFDTYSCTESSSGESSLLEEDVLKESDSVLSNVLFDSLKRFGLSRVIHKILKMKFDELDMFELKNMFLGIYDDVKRSAVIQHKKIEEYLVNHSFPSIPGEKFLKYHWSYSFYYDKDPEQLYQLVNDFTISSEKIAQIIILEKCLPNYLKSIKSVDLGKAGGEKFITKGIFFKFGKDKKINGKWLYGGNSSDDIKAGKALTNELKGLRSLYNLVVEKNLDIVCPLMCTITYLGISICAVSMLPISENTIVYGTMDAGMNLYDATGIPKVLNIVDTIASEFSFVEHPVRENLTNEIKYLKFGADVEVHQDEDGLIYMLDFGRFFPPNNDRDPFVCQFREEFLLSNKSFKYSPDAYTRFGTIDKAIYNTFLDEAISVLNNNIINPEFSFWTSLESGDIIMAKNNMKQLVHKFGFNMRHLGKLRKACPLQSPKISKHVKTLFLREMMLRSIKTLSRKKLYLDFQERSIPIESVYRRTIVDFYSSVKDDNSPFWLFPDMLKETIIDKFGYDALSDEEMKQNVNLLEIIGCSRDQSKKEYNVFMNMIPIYCSFAGGNTDSDTMFLSKTFSILRNQDLELREMQQVMDMKSANIFWNKRSFMYTYSNEKILYQFTKSFIECCQKKGAKFLIDYLIIKFELLRTMWSLTELIELFECFVYKLIDEYIGESNEVLIGISRLFYELSYVCDRHFLEKYIVIKDGECNINPNIKFPKTSYRVEEQNKRVEDILFLGYFFISGRLDNSHSFNYLELDTISKYLGNRNIQIIDSFTIHSPNEKIMKLMNRIQGISTLELLSCRSLSDENIVGINHLSLLSTLKIHGSADITDKALSIISELPNMTDLDLCDLPELTSNGYSKLSKLKKLTKLKIRNCNFCDEDVGILCFFLIPITELYLPNNKITDEACEKYLCNMTSLQKLSLSGGDISDNGIFWLGSLEKLEALFLSETKVSMDSLQDIQELDYLRALDLSDCQEIPPEYQYFWKSADSNVASLILNK